MEIQINNFKCHSNKEWKIQNSAITLLSGKSGAGKTTFLNSIFWCLYGEIQITNVSVKITFTKLNITIERSKPPEILCLIIKDKDIKLLNDEAQEYINEIFGNSKIFIASSYLFQGTRNPILSLSNSEKFDLLRNLCFDEKNTQENPVYYIEKIEILNNEIKTKLNKEIGYYNAIKENYTEKTIKCNEYIKLWEDRNTTVDFLKNQLKIYKEKELKLNEDIKKTKDIEIKNKILLDQYENLENQIKDLKEYDLKELENLNLEYNEIKNKILKLNILEKKITKEIFNNENIDEYEKKLLKMKEDHTRDIKNKIKIYEKNIEEYYKYKKYEKEELEYSEIKSKYEIDKLNYKINLTKKKEYEIYLENKRKRDLAYYHKTKEVRVAKQIEKRKELQSRLPKYAVHTKRTPARNQVLRCSRMLVDC